MLRDKIIAAARTGFAVLGATIVTFVVGKLTGWGFQIELDPTWSTALAGALFAVFVGLYNFAVAWLTENVWDGFGWLLGVNKPPTYVEETALPTVTGGTSWQDYLTSGDGNPDRA